VKNFATYAVTVGLDSPLGNGNNYFLANTGDGKGLKIVQYDHNNAQDPILAEDCSPECRKRFDKWAVVRPTCGENEDNPRFGPLVKDSDLFKKYMEYVKTFVVQVYTNQTLLEEMRLQMEAIAPLVTGDTAGVMYMAGGHISQAANPKWDWDQYGTPLLNFQITRGKDVLAQIENYESGKVRKFEKSEKCAEWTPQPEAKCGCFNVGGKATRQIHTKHSRRAMDGIEELGHAIRRDLLASVIAFPKKFRKKFP